TFISLWMGQQFGETSVRVLQVLILSWLFMAGNGCVGDFVFLVSEHRPGAILMVFGAIAHPCLSLFFVGRVGGLCVCLGFPIPRLVVHAFIWPRYITKILAIPVGRYLFQSWLRPAVAIIPFGIACILAERWWHAGTLVGFFLQMIALLPLALGGFALVF